MARTNIKRAKAIQIMNENANESISDVVSLIAETLDLKDYNARQLYCYIVRNDMAPGTIPARGRPKKVKIEKLELINPDTIDYEAIKEKNLRKIRSVHRQMMVDGKV
jgi:uncharacterized protein (UPF0297 family)